MREWGVHRVKSLTCRHHPCSFPSEYSPGDGPGGIGVEPSHQAISTAAASPVRVHVSVVSVPVFTCLLVTVTPVLVFS